MANLCLQSIGQIKSDQFIDNVKFNTGTKIIKWLHFKGNEWNGMNKKNPVNKPN